MKNDKKVKKNDQGISDLLTESEAAQQLRVSRITLQRARLAGKISFVRIGGSRVFYTLQHIQDYLDAQTRQPHVLQKAGA